MKKQKNKNKLNDDVNIIQLNDIDPLQSPIARKLRANCMASFNRMMLVAQMRVEYCGDKNAERLINEVSALYEKYAIETKVN